MSETVINDMAERLGRYLQKRNMYLVTAESCTGGGLAEIITRIPGSSHWFERGHICYSNLSKQELLGVNPEIINQYGAVSVETSIAMAEGALARSQAQISVAITGIAGPEGGTPEKPVGTVCIAWLRKASAPNAVQIIFTGDRLQVRKQACLMAIQGLIDIVES